MNFKTMIGAIAVTAGMAFAVVPAPAQAQSTLRNVVEMARVIVAADDIIYRNNVPYYRYGNYGEYDRLYRYRDGNRYVYYRNVPKGVAHGYYGTQPGHNKHRTNYRNYNRYDGRRYMSQKDYKKAQKRHNKARKQAQKRYAKRH